MNDQVPVTSATAMKASVHNGTSKQARMRGSAKRSIITKRWESHRRIWGLMRIVFLFLNLYFYY